MARRSTLRTRTGTALAVLMAAGLLSGCNTTGTSGPGSDVAGTAAQGTSTAAAPAPGGRTPINQLPGWAKNGGGKEVAAQNPQAPLPPMPDDLDVDAFLKNTARFAEDEKNYETAAAYWASYYERHPGDPEGALGLARNARMAGQPEQGIRVLTPLVSRASSDTELHQELARCQLTAGAYEGALGTLNAALRISPDDWSLYSKKGVALDKLQRHEEAAEAYEKGLERAPDNVALLNNYALSRALAGDAGKAEELLTRALQQPRGRTRTRQNLALVYGMTGRFEEASQIAREDLPDAVVAHNLKVYRDMLAEPDRWQALRR